MNIKDMACRQNGAKGRKNQFYTLFRQHFVKWRDPLRPGAVRFGHRPRQYLEGFGKSGGSADDFFDSVIKIGEIRDKLRPKTMTALQALEVT